MVIPLLSAINVLSTIKLLTGLVFKQSITLVLGPLPGGPHFFTRLLPQLYQVFSVKLKYEVSKLQILWVIL